MKLQKGKLYKLKRENKSLWASSDDKVKDLICELPEGSIAIFLSFAKSKRPYRHTWYQVIYKDKIGWIASELDEGDAFEELIECEGS